MAEAALAVAILALVVSAVAAWATRSQATSARKQIEFAERDRAESRRADIATSRQRIVRVEGRSILELRLTATNVGRAHARELKARVADHRRMAVSERHDFDEPLAPGESRPFVLEVDYALGLPHWLIYTWADEERDLQEKLEFVDDIGRTAWPTEPSPRVH